MTGWAGGFNQDVTTGGIFKYAGAVLGVTALTNDNSRMRMFPNPSNGQFTLQIAGAENKDAVVKIVDVTGRKIADAKQKQIDISNLPQGLYLLKVTDGELQFVKRFVKN